MVNVKQQTHLQKLEKDAFSSHLIEDLWMARWWLGR